MAIENFRGFLRDLADFCEQQRDQRGFEIDIDELTPVISNVLGQVVRREIADAGLQYRYELDSDPSKHHPPTVVELKFGPASYTFDFNARLHRVPGQTGEPKRAPRQPDNVVDITSANDKEDE